MPDPVIQCPPPEQLAAFNVGKLDEAAMLDVAEHVAGCTACESALDQLADTDDSMIAALRGRAPAPPPDRRLERLIEKAKAIGATTAHEGLEDTMSWDSHPADSRPATPAQWPDRVGRFEIERPLGSGAFGEVYLAHDPQLSRQVALKVPRLLEFATPSELAEFLDEARKAAALNHPRLVTIFEVSRPDDPMPFIAMEHMTGGSLAARLKAGPPFSLEDGALLVAKVAEGVHHAHKHDLVHRDLKPENILLDEVGEPKVADFGLAVHEDVQHQHAGEFAGTLPYMSPEQIRGKAEFLDARSDVYSLGVILYEMLTGRLPYKARTREQYKAQILERDPRPPSTIRDEVPPPLEAICLKALAKPVTDRYQNARELAAALRDFLASQTEPEKAPPRADRRLLLAGGIAAAIAVGVGLWRLLPPAASVPTAPALPVPIVLKDTRVVFKPDRRDIAPRQIDGEHLRISAKGPVLVRLGEVTAKRYEIVLHMRLAAHDDIRPAQTGLYFGKHPVAGGQRYQLVEVTRALQQTLMLYRRLKVIVLQPREDEKETTNIKETTVDPPPGGGNCTLSITVGERGLEVVSWNGRDQPTLTTKEANARTTARDYMGEFGVFVRFATVTITGAEIVILER